MEHKISNNIEGKKPKIRCHCCGSNNIEIWRDRLSPQSRTLEMYKCKDCNYSKDITINMFYN